MNFILSSVYRVIAVMTVIAFFAPSAGVQAATSSNAQSPLGVNLAPLGINTPEEPFLDIFKTNGGWITSSSTAWDTGEEQYLNVDSSGWPKTLTAVGNPSAQKFTAVGALLLRNLAPSSNGFYPAGQYVVLYTGEGTLTYSFDAVKVPSLSSAGRDVINVVTPTGGGGILVTITNTDPNHTGNYLRNIQVVKAEQESALKAGQIFSPTFLSLIKNYHTLRFMDWFQTNGSQLSSWSSRPLTTNMTWSSTAGAPIEVAIELANAISADAWLNVPHMADNNFMTQFATLAHSQLGTSQKVYLELSNEVWNSAFSQYNYAVSQGQAAFGSGYSTYTFEYNRNWFGMRTAQLCDIWKSVWGSDSGRVVCVMGAQAANPYTATDSLDCKAWTAGTPCSGHGIGAVAIAPYFGGSIPASFTSQSDGGLGSLFASLTTQNDPSVPVGGFLGQALGWVAAYPPAIAHYNLPLISYEGGQTFVSFPNGVNADNSNNAMTNLYIAANRDARMGIAYTNYLKGWKANGGQLFMQYNDLSAYSQYGEWGALESFMQTVSPLSSAPPKWQALQNFISGTPCWWTNCTGSTSGTGTTAAPKVPLPPANLSVH